MIGKLTNVVVECTDLAASRQYYTETLGLKVVMGGEGWACLDGGGTAIVLWQGTKAAVVMGFSGAVLDEVRTALAAKGIDVGSRLAHPGGQHYDVFDPDGNRVMIADC